MVSSTFRYLVYDIESITDKQLLQQVLYPEITDTEEAFRTHQAELAKEGRDFINPSFHQPIALAVLALNETYEISKIGLLGETDRTSESIVRHFWKTYNQSQPTLVDFNGKSYDLRLMELWAFRLGIAIKGFHYDKFGARYKFNEEQHFDLHEFLTNHGAIRFRGGLNLFAKLLGKPGKMETKGDQVQQLYDEGKIKEIEDYCLGDVMDTYFVFLRSLVIRGKLSLEQEKHLTDEAIHAMEAKHQEEGYFSKYLEKVQTVSDL